jgi:hypothetical protein
MHFKFNDLREMLPDAELAELVEGMGGGGWTRTNDLRIMRTQEGLAAL